PMRETTRDIGLMTRAGSPPSPAARALIDAIRVVATEVARTPHATAAAR
ncbi:LysR family transcriptional regulator, partial [Burkholderia pseudomallei]|nr:LysR family transcriptional regulator [Burkholderia pseudomallei]